jgi:hypothetical protein
MVRKLVVLLLIAGAAYFIYQQVGRPETEEEMLVTHLRGRFAVLVNNFASAAGRAGLIGMDTTSDAETVVTQVLKLKAELAELRAKLTEERAIGRADALSEKIEYFCRKNDIKQP